MAVLGSCSLRGLLKQAKLWRSRRFCKTGDSRSMFSVYLFDFIRQSLTCRICRPSESGAADHEDASPPECHQHAPLLLFERREGMSGTNFLFVGCFESPNVYFLPLLKAEEIFLNLVLEYMPDNVYQFTRSFFRNRVELPCIYVKVRLSCQVCSRVGNCRSSHVCFWGHCVRCSFSSCSGLACTYIRKASATAISSPRIC